MTKGEKEKNLAGIALWRGRGFALEQYRREDLRALTEEEAGRRFAQMVFNREHVWVAPARRDSKGLIEQQRIFTKSHEHRTRLRRSS